MPFFFVLSGMTFRLSKLRSPRLPTRKIGRSTLNLLLIYLIFQTAPLLCKLLCSPFINVRINQSHMIREIVLPSTFLWYLWVLMMYAWVFGWLYYIEFKNLEKWKLPLYFITLMGISCLATVLTKSVFLHTLCFRNLLRGGVFFAAGVYCHELKPILRHKAVTMDAAGIVTLNLVYMTYAYLIAHDHNVWIDSFFTMECNTIAVCVLLLTLFSRVRTIGANKWLTWLGERSLIIYLLHAYCVTAMHMVAVKLHIVNPFLALTAATLISLMICCAAAAILPNIPIVCLLFHPIEAVDIISQKMRQKKSLR
jgi:fucose 4-O-acetylase-like acetyltransferase